MYLASAARIARVNLALQVLGVAVLVPNAFYPFSFGHAQLVLCAVTLIALLTVVLKIGVFDVEPVDVARHAVRQSAGRAFLFVTLNPLTNIGLCATGGAAAMLIPAVGTAGLAARSEFAQQVPPAPALYCA